MLLAFPTAQLAQLVCRVHKFESFRSALRTGICQRQIEVGAFVSGPDATIYVLPPISFESQPGTLHRAKNAACEAYALSRSRPPHIGRTGLCSVLAKNAQYFGKKRQTHVHDQAGHVRRIYRSDANSAAPRERLWRRRPSKEPPWCCRTCRRECPVTTWEHEAVEPFFIVRRWYPELNRWETALTMRSENVVGAEVLKDGVRTEYIPVPVEE
jgi:hypothetical protein